MHRVIRIIFHYRSLCLLLLLIIQASGAAGETTVGRGDGTLQDYTRRVGKAKADLGSMYSLADADFDKGFTKQDQAELQRKLFSDIVAYLPPQETIQWQGAEIEVDNRWLHTRLEDLKKLPIESKERDPIVMELSERLLAIEAKIQEVEDSTAA